VRFRDCEPRTAMMADLNSANDSPHLIQQSTCEYGNCFYTLRRSANLLKVVHSRAIPPVDEQTSEVNTPLSTSLTLSPYSCFFAASWALQLDLTIQYAPLGTGCHSSLHNQFSPSQMRLGLEPLVHSELRLEQFYILLF